jgi:hypothetical protein
VKRRKEEGTPLLHFDHLLFHAPRSTKPVAVAESRAFDQSDKTAPSQFVSSLGNRHRLRLDCAVILIAISSDV